MIQEKLGLKIYPIIPMTREEEDEIVQLVNGYVNAKIKYDLCQIKIQEQTKALEQRSANIAILEAQIAESKTQLADNKTLLAEYKAKLAQDSAQSAQDKAQLEKTNAEIAATTQKLEELEVKGTEVNSALDEVKAKIKAKEESQINEVRKLVKKCLTITFGTNEETLCKTISQQELDKIFCVREKKCIGIDDEGMERVILTFVRMHNTERVNLTVFKEEFRGTSLIRLFNEVPKTNVKTVIIAKQLNDQELQWKTWLESNLADRKFSIIVKS